MLRARSCPAIDCWSTAAAIETDVPVRYVGRPERASPSEGYPAAHTAEQVGSHLSGYFSFQPLYDKITREQPDLFD